MTLITKENKDSYNSVVTDINQKISGLVDKIENLIKSSEDNSGKANEQLNVLIRKANNLKTYVNGLLLINKQIDAPRLFRSPERLEKRFPRYHGYLSGSSQG